MFNIDINKIVKDMKIEETLTKIFEEKFDLSNSEAKKYAKKLIEGSINRTDNTLNKTLIELSERNK